MDRRPRNQDRIDPSQAAPRQTGWSERASLSTGIIRLDLALGALGLGRGTLVEIEGSSGSGKTSLCQHIVAHAQRSGEACAWFDLDHTLDGAYASRCGVDPAQLYLASPQSGEQALEIALALVESGGLSLVVLDSLTALVSQAEMDAALGESGAQPGKDLIASALPVLSRAARQTGAILLLTKGLPYHPGGVYHGLSQNPARLALDLYAAQRLQLTHVKSIQAHNQPSGSRVQLKVLKDQVAATARTLDLDIMYNDGISDSAELLDLGWKLQLLGEQDGQLILEGLSLGCEPAGAQRYLQEEPRAGDRMRASIRQKIQAGLGQDHPSTQGRRLAP